MSKVLGFQAEPDEEQTPAAVGAMGAGISEPRRARRAEDRERFDAQARAYTAFRAAKNHGEDDASAVAIAIDVYHEQLTLKALRRHLGTKF